MKKEFVYNKLVRDLIPEVIKNKGKECKTHIADKEEYKQELLKKLREEVEEFIEEPCEEELADMLEVIEALVQYYNFSNESIDKTKIDKGSKRGKFNKRIILEKVME